MRTDALVAALAADVSMRYRPVGRELSLMLLVGGGLSLLGLLLLMGVRADLVPALGTWRFNWKLTLVFAAVAVSVYDCIRLSRPQERAIAMPAGLLVPALLLAAVGIELATVAPGDWRQRALGTNAVLCLTTIPALALAPMVALMIGMSKSAPASPAAAGAAVGRLAAALAASLYALNCFDDSPLFVAVWYTLAAIPIIGLGALLGAYVLRW